MKWIKASDRLPEDDKNVFIRNGDTMAIMYHKTAGWRDPDDDFFYVADTDEDYNNVEWLDESTTPVSKGVEEAAKEYMAKEFKGSLEQYAIDNFIAGAGWQRSQLEK